MTKKIVFVIHGLPMGGAEKWLITLANHFSQLSFEIHIILLSNQTDLQHELLPEVTVHQVLKNGRFDISIAVKLKKLIGAISPSVVCCINTYSFFLTKLGLFGNTTYPVLLSPHTTKPISWYNYVQNLMYYRLLDKTDTVIYLCKAQLNYLNAVYKPNNHRQKIIYNGIDINYFSPALISDTEVEAYRQHLGIYSNDKVIVQVARIQVEKRHQDAIAALAFLNEKNSHYKVHLLLVGGGNEDRIMYLKRLVASKKLDNQVHFIGSKADVRLFYKMSNVFTLTSESETFSLAALEAMSFGLPVVLTAVGGAGEMVVEYKNGFLVPVNRSKELALAWDKALSLRFNPVNIRQQVRDTFNLNNMLNEYADIFNSLSISSLKK